MSFFEDGLRKPNLSYAVIKGAKQPGIVSDWAMVREPAGQQVLYLNEELLDRCLVLS